MIHHLNSSVVILLAPTYLLDDDMQSEKIVGSKWSDRARLRVNLVSPQPTRSVHLILILPKFDTHFTFLQEYVQPPCGWQEKTYFVKPIRPSRELSASKTDQMMERLSGGMSTKASHD